MRLTGQSTHRANPKTYDSCPCCFGSLESVKRAMSEVSRALADPLPLLIQAQVGPAVDAVRLSGRDVMAGLRGAFGRFLPPPDLATFRAAVAGLDGAIEARTADLPPRERDALAGLRDALGGLGDALTTLGMELDDASHRARRRAGPRLTCEFVDDQPKPTRDHRAVAGAALEADMLRTAEGMGG